MISSRKPGERTVTVDAVRYDFSGTQKQIKRDLFLRTEVCELLGITPATLSRRVSLLRELSPEFAAEHQWGSDQWSRYAIWALYWAESFIKSFPGRTSRSKLAALRKYLIKNGIPNQEFLEWKNRFD